MPRGIKGFQDGHKHSDETKRKISQALSKKVEFSCDYCGRAASDKPSSYKRKKRHYCSTACYAKDRKNNWDASEQPTWRGGITAAESHRRWKKKNPERMAHLKARRYARERGAEGSHTLEEWEELKAMFNQTCGGCKKGLPLTKDHVIPLSEGGSDFIGNIQPLCKSCNSRKWKHIHENPELLNN